jgi:hypothetical protein
VREGDWKLMEVSEYQQTTDHVTVLEGTKQAACIAIVLSTVA